MGMTIDTAKTVLFNMLGEKVICEPTEQNKAIAVAIKTMQNYQMMQADYNARLKADMVAMLTELQLEIEEKFNDRPFSYNHHQRTEFYRDSNEIIQQKINSLEEA